MKYLKLFENFGDDSKGEDISLKALDFDGYEEYDPYSYEGCGCCPVCTGEKDCECGCPECNYPDEFEGLDESKKSGVTASLKKKSKASGIPMGILRKVFAKGMQAWNAGHRPGVAQHQWGMGRVNSFITGAGGARKADADLWTKAKAAKARKKKKVQESFLIPKAVRKFNPSWKDEDIALEILKELKSLKGNSEGIAKLLISEDYGYSFMLDGFKFHVKYGFSMNRGERSILASGDMKMNDKYMKVSTEVCKQIFNLVKQLKNTDRIEMEEDDKKDFRINRGLM